MTYRNRIGQDGPKRLLALDGGGIRGVLSLEILAAIETLLRRELGRGDEMFGKASMMRRFRYQYDSTRLEKMLKSTFGADTTFGDDGLRTLLMMVLRNASTDSPWPLSNNPGAKYNAADRADNNLSLPLRQLVGASTAAPVYFPPEVVTIGNHEFVFVDGGLTMYTNQAFQLYLMATLEAYGLGWPVGEDKLLVVSVGTRAAPKADHRRRARRHEPALQRRVRSVCPDGRGARRAGPPLPGLRPEPSQRRPGSGGRTPARRPRPDRAPALHLRALQRPAHSGRSRASA